MFNRLLPCLWNFRDPACRVELESLRAWCEEQSHSRVVWCHVIGALRDPAVLSFTGDISVSRNLVSLAVDHLELLLDPALQVFVVQVQHQVQAILLAVVDCPYHVLIRKGVPLLVKPEVAFTICIRFDRNGQDVII